MPQPTHLISPYRLVRPPTIGRRLFLAGAGTSLVLAGCGGGTAAVSQPTTVPTVDDFLLLQAGFSDGLRGPATLAAGTTERAPFFLYGGDGLPVVNGVPDEIAGQLTAPDDTSTSVVLVQRSEGVSTPYFVLTFDPVEPGTYTLEADLDGEAQNIQFVVSTAAETGLVQIGDPLRAAPTATFDDARGYDPICTRFDPCPFHEINLEDAVSNGRPTALLIATPGFCQTTTCGPSVELLIDLNPSGTVNTIHAEVYTEPGRINEVPDFQELIGATVDTYGMVFEPSFIVADADGIVTARLDYAFDRSEMAEALDTVGA